MSDSEVRRSINEPVPVARETAPTKRTRPETAKLIKRAGDTLPSYLPKAGRDYVCVCTRERGDRWTLFPIADADLGGRVLAVLTEAGADTLLYDVREGSTVLTVEGGRFNRKEIQAKCWTEYRGLAALRDDLQSIRKPPRKRVSLSGGGAWAATTDGRDNERLTQKGAT